MATDSSKIVLKANLPRTRDLSFVGRFHHNFGFENGLFEYLLTQKDLWGDKLFYFKESDFERWANAGQQKVREISICDVESNFPDIEGEQLLELDFLADFGLIKPINLKVAKNGASSEQELAPGDQILLRNTIGRNGIALNVGGAVTAMKWLPYGNSPILAVAVINNREGLPAMISDPYLGVYPHEKLDGKTKSALQIWKFHAGSMVMELFQVYETSAFGATATINWVPLKLQNEEVFGVLAASFSDGKLHMFKVKNHVSESAVYTKVSQPSWTISMKDERVGNSGQILPITCYDFVDDKRVLVGTLDGAIAEYVLPNTSTEELKEPSFLEYVADSCITSVSIGESNNSKIVLVNTASTQAFALQYENIRQSRVDTNYTISPLMPLYHRGFRIFVYPDSAESIGYTFVRHPHQKHSLLLKSEMVSSFHVSEYLNHPLAIVSSILGDVYVLNIGRKIFGVPKAHNKLVVPLKLWSLSIIDNQLTLCGDYVEVKMDRTDIKWSFTPPEVVVSASAWNETFEGSSTYTFGTYTGLLVLERLDPSLT
ncbi:CIC11C00000000852 [Sungouiella intermedia]|uniref:CIC11C00000000852 n=1 Tax=Sungouiella intermedia TaxID=45354 RepID=A0A1L0G1M2_9ASCO|nr:CIC11C00000000852 [[Candida] intermedia]